MSDTEDLRDSYRRSRHGMWAITSSPTQPRRRPAYLYFAIAAVCCWVGVVAEARPGARHVKVCRRLLTGVGLIRSLGWIDAVDEKQALVAAQGAVGSRSDCWRTGLAGLLSPNRRVPSTPPKPAAAALTGVCYSIAGTVVEHSPRTPETMEGR